MTTSESASSAAPSATPDLPSAVEALEKDPRWQRASEAQRVVLKRIAVQRDRWAQTRKARQQAKALAPTAVAVRPDAPLPERLLVFARLHPVATALTAGVALMVGPRRLLRYGTWVMPIISRFKR